MKKSWGERAEPCVISPCCPRHDLHVSACSKVTKASPCFRNMQGMVEQERHSVLTPRRWSKTVIVFPTCARRLMMEEEMLKILEWLSETYRDIIPSQTYPWSVHLAQQVLGWLPPLARWPLDKGQKYNVLIQKQAGWAAGVCCCCISGLVRHFPDKLLGEDLYEFNQSFFGGRLGSLGASLGQYNLMMHRYKTTESFTVRNEYIAISRDPPKMILKFWHVQGLKLILRHKAGPGCFYLWICLIPHPLLFCETPWNTYMWLCRATSVATCKFKICRLGQRSLSGPVSSLNQSK